MQTNYDNGILTISPEGRIDTNNANDIQNALDSILSGYPSDDVIMNFEAVDYISSAGLRIMLKLRRAKPGLKIVDVQPVVYEVFETTGFTEMMNVVKGYRQVNLDNCEIIGEGSNGIVYRQDSETVVKVYKDHNSLADIKRERELARTALIKGIPTAISFDIVKYKGQLASVFELLNAKSISKKLMADSSDENIDRYAQVFVDVLNTIHASVDDGHVTPDQKETALGWVEYIKDSLPEDKYEKLHRMMQDIPESDHILHGDYHTNNVLIQEDGEPVLIDMDTLSHGDPIFEWGSIYNAYLGFSATDHSIVESFLKIDYDTAQRFYTRVVEKYWNNADDKVIEDACMKAMLMGDIRLLRRTLKRMGDTEEGRALAEHYRSEILMLLDEVDDFRLGAAQ